MSKCPTASGQFQCSKEVGHSDECAVTAKEYIDSMYRISTIVNVLNELLNENNKEIDSLRHIEEAALQLMKWPIASERFTEKLSELFCALKDRQ